MKDLRSMPRMTLDQERLFLIDALSDALHRHPLHTAYAALPGTPHHPEARFVPQLRFTLVLKGIHTQYLDLGNGPASLTMHPGDVLFMPPGSWRLPVWESARVIFVVLFSRYSIRCSCHHLLLGRQSVERARCVITPVMAGADASLLHAIEEYSAMRSLPLFFPRLVHCLMLRVIDAMRELSSPATKALTTFASVCDFLREHFREPLSRESVATALRIHPAHVSRLFRTMAGTTFQDYLQETRIEFARQLLQDPALSFKEIALSCGFRDADHFRDVFKRCRKESPLAYRDSVLHKGKKPPL